MQEYRKIKLRDPNKKRNVPWAKESDFSPEVWARLNSGEPLFPEKVARCNEVLSKIKWLKDR